MAATTDLSPTGLTVREALDAVTTAARETESVFELGGQIVRFSTHGDEVARFQRPFAHRPKVNAESKSSDLHLEAIIAPGGLPLQPPDQGAVDGRWLHESSTSRTMLGGGQLNHLDQIDPLSWGVWWGVGSRADHPWEESAPVRLLLDWWGSARDLHLVHAGAVGSEDGAVLLVGPGGSGKSTSCLACIGSSLSYLSDDYCMVSLQPEPVVHSLYATGKADARSRELLAHLEIEDTPTRVDGKVIIDVADRFPDALALSQTLRAIVVPQVDSTVRSPALVPLPAPHALRALAPSTMFQLPGSPPTKLERLSRLVRLLPAYSLTVGSDVAAIPEALGDVIAAARPGP
jgi:hypothetical protein